MHREGSRIYIRQKYWYSNHLCFYDSPSSTQRYLFLSLALQTRGSTRMRGISKAGCFFLLPPRLR